MKTIVGFTLELSAKAVFSFDKFQLKNMGRKLCFCYSTYRKYKKFYWSAPNPRDQTNAFAYKCCFTFYTPYKNGMIGHGGNAVKMLKNTYL